MHLRHCIYILSLLCLFVLPVMVVRADEPLIASITKETLWRNRDGKAATMFHPRACMVPDSDGKPIALMTIQEIGGSDYFGPVHWTTSSPDYSPGLNRKSLCCVQVVI